MKIENMKPTRNTTPKRGATNAPQNSPKRSTNKTTPKHERTGFQSLLRNIVLAVSLLVIALFVVNIILGIITRHGANKDVPNFVGATVEQAEDMARKGRLAANR